eukprot:CAMPEP_0115767438 /NCGR_PEP_ID=MMETSP0272-20121206/103673_1 /TAXON_ID=71861 /ORGANISM="Scrippsiella trochoidea, Strain CCMP3099" /LENGTH=122 /DNA_ID=CAMNT_0003213451 /DNA_START=739 /DNA_END=1108 /DNA_ORIENTATION=-
MFFLGGAASAHLNRVAILYSTNPRFAVKLNCLTDLTAAKWATAATTVSWLAEQGGPVAILAEAAMPAREQHHLCRGLKANAAIVAESVAVEAVLRNPHEAVYRTRDAALPGPQARVAPAGHA